MTQAAGPVSPEFPRAGKQGIDKAVDGTGGLALSGRPHLDEARPPGQRFAASCQTVRHRLRSPERVRPGHDTDRVLRQSVEPVKGRQARIVQRRCPGPAGGQCQDRLPESDIRLPESDISTAENITPIEIMPVTSKNWVRSSHLALSWADEGCPGGCPRVKQAVPTP